MLKLAICEDNDIQCRQIHTLSCSSLEIPVEIDTFSSATDFLNQISNEQCPYHIILMDIELGSESVSGINLLNPNTQIIFISQYLQYASSVYETDHIYFVYKQQMEEYLPKALSASCRKLNKLRQQYFCFNYQSRDYRLLRSDIFYMERKLRNTEIHTKSQIYYCREKIPILIEQLKPDFCICHKSFAVNINTIQTITRQLKMPLHNCYSKIQVRFCNVKKPVICNAYCCISFNYACILFHAAFSQTNKFKSESFCPYFSLFCFTVFFSYDQSIWAQ